MTFENTERCNWPPVREDVISKWTTPVVRVHWSQSLNTAQLYSTWHQTALVGIVWRTYAPNCARFWDVLQNVWLTRLKFPLYIQKLPAIWFVLAFTFIDRSFSQTMLMNVFKYDIFCGIHHTVKMSLGWNPQPWCRLLCFLFWDTETNCTFAWISYKMLLLKYSYRTDFYICVLHLMSTHSV